MEDLQQQMEAQQIQSQLSVFSFYPLHNFSNFYSASDEQPHLYSIVSSTVVSAPCSF